MNLKSLSVWMKIVLVGFALCGAAVFLFAIPEIGRSLTAFYPEFGFCYVPWLIFLWIAAAPCYAVLVLGWLIASNIARDHAFSAANSGLLKAIAVLAAADAFYFWLGNIVLWLMGMNHPGIMLLSLVIVFIGFAICIASLALSRLTSRAADIEDENKYTI